MRFNSVRSPKGETGSLSRRTGNSVRLPGGETGSLAMPLGGEEDRKSDY